MKTLEQLESRTPIPGGSAPYTISASRSYYLTGNITVASGDEATLSGLTLGTNVWVRVATAGLKGVMGAWSDPAKLMVT